jgi:hypothetical protein
MGAFLLARDSNDVGRGAGISYAVVGGALAIVAPIGFLQTSAGETLDADFNRDLASGVAPRRRRGQSGETPLRGRGKSAYAAHFFGQRPRGAVTDGVFFVMNELKTHPDDGSRAVLTSGLLLGKVVGFALLQPSPIERLADVWRQEPSRPRWSFAPVGPRGPEVSFGAVF